jgi:hypothetical protein
MKINVVILRRDNVHHLAKNPCLALLIGGAS